LVHRAERVEARQGFVGDNIPRVPLLLRRESGFPLNPHWHCIREDIIMDWKGIIEEATRLSENSKYLQRELTILKKAIKKLQHAIIIGQEMEALDGDSRDNLD